MARPIYKPVGLPRKDPRYMEIWWELNREACAAVRAENYKVNRIHVLKKQKEYQNRPEIKAKVLARATKWQRDFPEKVNAKNSKWRADNPVARSVEKARRRSLMQAAPGNHTRAEAVAILEAQKQICANPYCGVLLKKGNKHLDHILPLTKGGSNFSANLQWLCVTCNTRKHDAIWEVWLEGQRLLYEAKHKDAA